MRLGDKQEQRTCLSLCLLGNQMIISSFTASSCFLQATLQSRSWFRPEPFRRPCWSSKGRVRKKRTQKLLSDSTNPPSRIFGSLDQLLSAKWIEKNLCWDPLPNNHEFHHRPQKTFSNHSTIVNQIIIKSGYEDHLSFRADGFGRIFKAPGEHLDKMEWNKNKCIHRQIKYKIKYVHGWIEVWTSKQQPNTNKPLKSWAALKEEEEPLFLLEIADKTLMLGHTQWWQGPEDPEQLSLCLLQKLSVKWDKGGWQTSR